MSCHVRHIISIVFANSVSALASNTVVIGSSIPYVGSECWKGIMRPTDQACECPKILVVRFVGQPLVELPKTYRKTQSDQA